MSNVGATVSVTVVVPVQLTVPSDDIFCFGTSSTVITEGAEAKVKTALPAPTLPLVMAIVPPPAVPPIVEVRAMALCVIGYGECLDGERAGCPGNRDDSDVFERIDIRLVCLIDIRTGYDNACRST